MIDIFSKESSILVIGDVMLDRYYTGDTHRISPEAPVPVVKIGDSNDIVGGAANVALNAITLNAKTSLLGICGNDSNADILNQSLISSGIICKLHRVSDKPTITKTRIMSRHQQLIRLDKEECFSEIDLQNFIDNCLPQIVGHKVVVLSDYAKGAINYPESIIAECNKNSIPVLIDPKGKDYSKYKGATILTPNMFEFEEVVGECKSEEEIVSKAYMLIEQLALGAILLTRSEKGMILFELGELPIYFAAQARDVFDVTGAGDTVIATLATCLAAGASMKQSAKIANIAAGIVVLKMGTATVSIGEIHDVLNNVSANQNTSVVGTEELCALIKSAHDTNEKIVMTNGCFDILHPGHVSYLQKAKEQGDRLIVAVNSDNSVKRLKGEERPINNLESRMAVLAGLSSIDWVVSFSEDTPEILISTLLPDVLVKGGDYTVEQVAGASTVISNGGEVKILNFEVGCSTSAIVKSIQNRKKDKK